MKTKILVISSLVAGIILTGCNQSANNAATNKEVPKQKVEVTGIRKAPLNKDSQNLEVIKYTSALPGSKNVKLYKPSYMTAPPMIPHSIAGMTPITIKHNACLMCHMPKNAKMFHAIPIPQDHFIDNFEGGKHIKRVAGSRYNCTTCHDRQAQLDPVVENKFESMKAKAGIK